MKRIIYAALIFTGLVNSSIAASNTITFDEPEIVVPQGAVVSVSNIDNMAFGGLRVFDASNLYGHIDLAVSGTNAAYFGPSDTLIVNMANGGTFDFNSAYFGSTNGASFTLQAFKAGVLAFSGTANSPQFTPAQFIADWTGIDLLTIQSAYFLNGYNVMDNLSYTQNASPVPEPNAYFLFLVGLGLISATVSWRKGIFKPSPQLLHLSQPRS